MRKNASTLYDVVRDGWIHPYIHEQDRMKNINEVHPLSHGTSKALARRITHTKGKPGKTPDRSRPYSSELCSGPPTNMLYALGFGDRFPFFSGRMGLYRGVVSWCHASSSALGIEETLNSASFHASVFVTRSLIIRTRASCCRTSCSSPLFIPTIPENNPVSSKDL